MKKITATFVLLSMFFMVVPFAIQAQTEKFAKVTITINSLFAKSSDACGNMDFFAKIYIGDQVKSFPVREGNYLTNLNWQFWQYTLEDKVTFSVEIWDDDEAFCGEGDDRVNVDGRSNKITKTFSTLVPYDRDMRSDGVQTANSEVAEIVFRIKIEPRVTSAPVLPDPVPVRPVTVPIKPVTVPVKPITLPEEVVSKKRILTGGIWKIVEKFSKIRLPGMPASPGSSYLPTFLLNFVPNCQKDNYYQFYSDGTYRLDDGRTKCAPADPQIIETGTWSFLEAETKLQLVKTGSLTPEVFRIKLTISELNLYKSDYYIHCTH